MKKLLVVVALGALLVAAGYAVTGARTQKNQIAPPVSASNGTADAPAAIVVKPAETRPATTQPAQGALAAMQRAAEAKKFIFLFVYDQDNDQTREARKKFDAAIAKLGDTAQWATVDRTAASEKQFIEQLKLKAVPTPFALALAPNGAVTGGFLASNLTEQKLLDAVVSPAQQACMKALQERKLVLLCAQNNVTEANDLAMKGVNEFKADSQFAEVAVIVKMDPADRAERKFVEQLRLTSSSDQATTVLLAPPGSIVAKFPGATTKEGIVAALKKPSAGCSGTPGCCPSSK